MSKQLQISVLVSALYELSLTIGATLDLETSCSTFLQALTARMGLGSASVWIYSHMLTTDPGSEEPESTLTLAYATPQTLVMPEQIPLDHPVPDRLRRTGDFELWHEDPACADLRLDGGKSVGTLTTFHLERIGLLQIFQHGRPDPASPPLKNLLRNLVYRFSISLESCLIVRWQELEMFRRKQAEQELRVLSEVAEHASRAKSEFLASMSHEIRTPISAVMGYANLLERSPDPRHFVEWTQRIQKNAKHLLHLVDDILDLAKVESKRIELQYSVFRPADLLRDVRHLMATQAEKKGLTLNTAFCHPVSDDCVSDPHRVRQVVINLVSNAIKYTPTGLISIISQIQTPADGDVREWQVSVVDTGVGMPQDVVARIFEPFYRASTSSDSIEEGTGLGLYITSRILEVLGGRVEVKSELGKGSTFTVFIPVKRPESLQPPQPELDEATRAARSLTGLKILLVDDGDDNRNILRYILEEKGAQVETAVNGRDAVSRESQHRQAGRPFQLILMDMRMPVMDGFSATRQLRKDGVKTPVIALTAYAMVRDRDLCLEAGCDDYLAKPVSDDLLVATCMKWTLGMESGATAENSPTESFTMHPGGDMVLSNKLQDGKFQALLTDYLNHLDELVHSLPELVRAGHREDLHTHVHQLKGSGVGYGFPTITYNAQLLEQAINAGETVDEGHPLLVRLLEQLERAVQMREKLSMSPRAAHE